MPRIPDTEIAAAGGDWGGYGEIDGPTLLQLLQQDKLRLLFANNSILVSLQRPDGVVGDYQLIHTAFATPKPPTVEPFTAEQIASATNCPVKNVQLCWPVLYGVMTKYSLGSPAVIAGMVGTIAVETGVFLPVREGFYIYSPDPTEAERLFKIDPTPAYNWYNDTTRHAAYEGGPEYHGRGFVQTTHKSNYAKVEVRSGLPVLSQPDLLLQPEPASHAICAYWLDNNLQVACEARDWPTVRRRVYGGDDAAGIQRIARAAQVLGVV